MSDSLRSRQISVTIVLILEHLELRSLYRQPINGDRLDCLSPDHRECRIQREHRHLWGPHATTGVDPFQGRSESSPTLNVLSDGADYFLWNAVHGDLMYPRGSATWFEARIRWCQCKIATGLHVYNDGRCFNQLA